MKLSVDVWTDQNNDAQGPGERVVPTVPTDEPFLKKMVLVRETDAVGLAAAGSGAEGITTPRDLALGPGTTERE